MESIFESLENLNVSEECFNDIMSIVEDIMHQIEKVHGCPSWKEGEDGKSTPANKSAELAQKAYANMYKAEKRRKISTEYTPKVIQDYYSTAHIKLPKGKITKNRASELLRMHNDLKKLQNTEENK